MKDIDIHKTVENCAKIDDFLSSESQLGAQICIEKVFDINLWDTERRPGEPQGGLQELQSHDPSSLLSDSELPRSYDGHRPSCDPAATGLRPPFDPSNICRRRGPLKLMSRLIS